MPRVLVVGAGATGASVALRLRQVMGREVHIEVWEKARGPGGRMSTNRQELEGATVRADMGAQYLSLNGGDPASTSVAELLTTAGVCAELPAVALSETPERPKHQGWRHLAGTAGGVSDALKQLLEAAGAELHCERRVASLDEQQCRWRARPFEGAPAYFDAVVLAVPGCGVGGDNLNKIHGNYEAKFSPDQNRALLSAQHDARWAFALFLSMECKPRCDEFFGPVEVEKVVEQGPLHLLCYQSRKTEQLSGASPSGAVVVIAHTTLQWAKRNARASGRDDRLLYEVAEYVKCLLAIDAPLSKVMLSSKVITWKQCQVTRPTPVSHASGPCMLVSQSPALVLAGDYFTESNFTGCVRSGFAAAEAVAGALTGCTPECGKGGAVQAAHAGSESGASAKGGKEGRSKGAEGAKGGKDGRAKGAEGTKGGKEGRSKGWEDTKGQWKGGKGKRSGGEADTKTSVPEGGTKWGGGSKGKGKGYAWQPVAGA